MSQLRTCVGIGLISLLLWTTTQPAFALGLGQDKNGPPPTTQTSEQTAAEAQIKSLVDETNTLIQAGKLNDAIARATQALKLAEANFAPDHQLVYTSLDRLAFAYFRKRNFNQALPLAKRALAMVEAKVPPNDPEIAMCLQPLIFIYKEQSQADQAEPLAQRAITILETAEGKEHPSLIGFLTMLGEIKLIQQKSLEARSVLERALAIAEKQAGPQSHRLSPILFELSQTYQATRNYPKAEELYLRGVNLLEKGLGPQHPQVGFAYNNFVILLINQNEFIRALPLQEKSVAILEKSLGPEHLEYASASHQLGQLYHKLSQFSQAQVVLNRALAIRQKVYGPTHPLTVRTLTELSNVYLKTGNYTELEFIHRFLLDYLEKNQGMPAAEQLDLLIGVAVGYHNQGNYAQTEALYFRILDLIQKHPELESEKLNQIQNNLAWVYAERRDFAKSEPLFLEIIARNEKRYGRQSGELVLFLNNLGSMYFYAREFTKAEPLLLESRAIFEKGHSTDQYLYTTTLNNLATLYEAQNDFDKAEACYQQAAGLREKTLGPDHPDMAHLQVNLGFLYFRKGEFARAEAMIRRAVGIQETKLSSSDSDLITGFNDLALISLAQKKIDQAITYQLRANQAIEANFLQNLIAGSERQKQIYINSTSESFDRTLSLHAQSAPTNPAIKQEALTAILRRKGRALDMASGGIEALRRRSSPADQALLQELEQTRAQMATLTLKGPDQKTTESYRAQLKTLEDRAEELETKLSLNSLDLRSQLNPVTLSSIQKLIPANASLIEFATYRPLTKPQTRSYGPARYIVYTLDQTGDIKWVDLGECAPIDRAVAEFRQVLSTAKSDPGKEVSPRARKVYELVMKPVTRLVGNHTQLILSPDGELNLLPFGALITEKNKYLIERYSVSYVSSGRDLLRLQNQVRNQEPPLIVADPQYVGEGPMLAGVRANPLQRLIETAEEGKQLQALFPNAVLKLREEATEDIVKSAKHPSILHLAAHGFFLEESAPDKDRDLLLRSQEPQLSANLQVSSRVNPLLRSGLFLANTSQPGRRQNDGTLTALEMTNLDLTGTKLVVLSACNTGVGDIKNGAGVYGLRRALVLAGSETQLTSLWKVSDLGTRKLMVDYYTRLKAGEGRSEALRQVQLSMLASPRWRHPFYWASFIQSGQWKPLEE
ncbi:MAG TPA: CHAT domain-containing protein [Acidobacteriota bacterium]|nr:CHAT domain-containing protein [Acidobacteriota bacterium]